MNKRMLFLVNNKSDGEFVCKKIRLGSSPSVKKSSKKKKNPQKSKNSVKSKKSNNTAKMINDAVYEKECFKNDESKTLLKNLLKDDTLNNLVDYKTIKQVTLAVTSIELTPKNATEVFSCIHVIDKALQEIEEILTYIKRLIFEACEKVMLDSDWKDLNNRIDNMIIEIDTITQNMVDKARQFLKLC